MAILNIQIDNILSGWQTSEYYGGSGQFLDSVGIDPDMPKDDSGTKPSGFIRPTAMTKFSGTEITGVPLWFVSNPKTDKTYLYANDGKVHTIDSDLTMGTALNSGTALSSSSGNGAAYYDNYVYFAKNADIARYGPLNGSASLTQDYWTNTLSLTAPSDTTYPTINGVEMPNHIMHRHTDDRLYFADVDTNNKGILNYVKTTKTTVEGDTDDNSTYSALDFDHGEYITSIETFNNNLAIGLIEGTNTTIIQEPAKIAFWDAASDSFDSITSVELHDPLITALKNVDGTLYVFSGYATGGCRISRLVGNFSIQEVAWIPDIYPPISQGAIDHLINRIVFGSNTVTPEASASVFAYGSKEGGSFPLGLHNIVRGTGTGNNPWVTAVKYLSQGSGKIVQPIIGWDDDSAKGLDKTSTTYGNYNVWKSGMFRLGGKFKILKVTIPLADAVTTNMSITPTIYYNDGDSSLALKTINPTSFPNGERCVDFYPQAHMENNFYLQLEWTGSALLTVGLPITITIETIE